MQESQDKKKGKPGRGRRENNAARSHDDAFEQQIIDLARVTRVMAGGKRMRFRACVAIGDNKGKLGVGLAKGADVTMAVNKAVNKAKKHMISVPMVRGTIPHTIEVKYKAARVLMRPAQEGKGIVAGGAMRQLLELSGLTNVVGKILGSNNKINVVRATLAALQELQLSNHDRQQTSSAGLRSEMLVQDTVVAGDQEKTLKKSKKKSEPASEEKKSAPRGRKKKEDASEVSE